MIKEKNLPHSLAETLEEWNERLRDAGFADHLDYFRWRRKRIWEQRNAGMTYVSLGKEHGISTRRARQVYLQHERVKTND